MTMMIIGMLGRGGNVGSTSRCCCLGWSDLVHVDAFVIPSSFTRTSSSSTTRSTSSSSTTSSTTSLFVTRQIDNWIVTNDGRIDGILKRGGDQITTSVLVDPTVANSNVIVTTLSGSRYKLLTPRQRKAATVDGGGAEGRTIPIQQQQQQIQQPKQIRRTQTIQQTNNNT